MKERDVDINIAVDILRFALENDLERVYLFTGDGDLAPAVKLIKSLGKEVKLITSEGNSLSLFPSLKE